MPALVPDGEVLRQHEAGRTVCFNLYPGGSKTFGNLTALDSVRA
jgi:hypothetical protein